MARGDHLSSLDFNLNFNPTGLTATAEFIFIAENRSRNVHVFNKSGIRQTSRLITLHADNSNPSGLTNDGTYLYVADSADDRIYVYTLAGVRQQSREFNIPAADIPASLATDGVYIYPASGADGNIRTYTIAGVRQSSRDITTLASLRFSGLTYAGGFICAAGSTAPAGLIAMNSAGVRQSSQEFAFATANSSPAGLTNDGNRFYVANTITGGFGSFVSAKVFVYEITASTSVSKLNLGALTARPLRLGSIAPRAAYLGTRKVL